MDKQNSKKLSTILDNAIYCLRLTFTAHPSLFVLMVIMQLVGSVMPFLRNRYFGALIDSITQSQTSVQFFLAFITVFFVSSLAMIFQNQFSRLIDIRLQSFLRKIFIGKIANLDYQHLEGKETSNLISKTDEEFGWRIRETVNHLNNVIANLISLISVTVIILPKYPALWTIIFLSQIPQYIIERYWIKKEWLLFEQNSDKNKMRWDLNWQLRQKNFIAELRINNATDYLYQKFCNIFDFFANKNTELKINRMPSQIGLTFFSIFINSFCLLNLIYQVQQGHITIGLFTFYFQVIIQTADYFRGLVYGAVNITEQSYHIDNFRQVMGLKNKIVGGSATLDISSPPKIEFIDVSFKYPNTNQYIFRHLNLTINPSEEIAIVGPNGAGKSTLVKLLCRFYQPTSGQILVNGVDLNEIKTQDWYDQLSYLSQEFNTYNNLSLMENVAISQPGNMDRKKVSLALKKADASFVSQYSQGLDTLMSSRYGGEEPSWGQWQKIAIARIFYRHAKTLILDEPTASIDAVSEYKIFNQLYKRITGKTLIIISHRFSTVRNAQRIIVIDKGKIVEQGNHEKLIKNKNLYAKSFHLQARGYQ